MDKEIENLKEAQLVRLIAGMGMVMGLVLVFDAATVEFSLKHATIALGILSICTVFFKSATRRIKRGERN